MCSRQSQECAGAQAPSSNDRLENAPLFTKFSTNTVGVLGRSRWGWGCREAIWLRAEV